MFDGFGLILYAIAVIAFASLLYHLMHVGSLTMTHRRDEERARLERDAFHGAERKRMAAVVSISDRQKAK